MTTTTLFSCQACHSKGGSSEEAKGQQQRQQQRLQCSFPAVKAARPVRHPHCATCAGATSCCCCCSGGFEFELVGILQRATHSLAPPCSSQWGHSASFHCLFIRCALSLPRRPPFAVSFLLLLLCLVSLLFFSPHSSWRLFIYPQLYPWHASRTVQGSKAASRRGCYISRPQPSVRFYSF